MYMFRGRKFLSSKDQILAASKIHMTNHFGPDIYSR
jgi:hypothetical protein